MGDFSLVAFGQCKYQCTHNAVQSPVNWCGTRKALISEIHCISNVFSQTARPWTIFCAFVWPKGLKVLLKPVKPISKNIYPETYHVEYHLILSWWDSRPSWLKSDDIPLDWNDSFAARLKLWMCRPLYGVGLFKHSSKCGKLCNRPPVALKY